MDPLHPGESPRRGRQRLRPRLRGPILSGALGLTSAVLLAAAATAAPRPSPVVVGAWLTYWDWERGLSRIASDAGSRLHDRFLFAAALAPDGTLNLQIEASKLALAIEEGKRSGADVWLTLVNDVHSVDPSSPPRLKDGALVHRLLSEPGSMAAHRDEIVSLARRLSVSGIDLDYENLDPADRQRFTVFVGSLAAALRKEQVRLSVTVQPKTSRSTSMGAGAADWRALCDSVDRLQVMLYNLHSARTEPGPMATTEWMSKVLRFALQECVSSRVIPVLKLSGMEWSPAGTRGVQHDECMALAGEKGAAIERDEIDRVPHFRYATEDGPAFVYFEDAASIGRKVELLESMGLRQILLWSLGREDPAILPSVLP